MAYGMVFTTGHIDQLKTDVGVVGIAKNFCAGPVGGDVPGVEFGDGANLFGVPIHIFQRFGPYGKNQIAGFAQKGFVYHKLIVVVFVEAFEAGAVAAHAENARGGVACEFDPIVVYGMKLGMDDGSGEVENDVASTAISGSDYHAIAFILFDGSNQPASIGAATAFTELSALQLVEGLNGEVIPIEGFDFVAAGEVHAASVFRQNGGIWVIAFDISELANFAVREIGFEQLGRTGAV